MIDMQINKLFSKNPNSSPLNHSPQKSVIPVIIPVVVLVYPVEAGFPVIVVGFAPFTKGVGQHARICRL